MRGLLILVIASIAFGIIDELQVDPSLIEEKIETNCPSDPTFGGACNLVETKVPEGQECREINGVKICRDWWKKEYTYKCDGKLDFKTFLSSLSGQDYCTYEKECLSWQNIQKNGGIVSCRVYYDKNKPGCDSNPQRPECLNDDCGELFDKCTLLNYTSYSDIKDKANPETTTYCDPVSGMCGFQSIPGISGVSVGIYTFKCPKDVGKICTKWQIKKKCPNGIQTICNTVRMCKVYKQGKSVGKQLKTCQAPRLYDEYKVIKNSRNAKNLKTNNLCIKVGETTKVINTIGYFAWGWDGDFGDDCGSCESYVTGLYIQNPEGGNFNGSQTCYKVSGSPNVFPSSSQLITFFNDYFKNTLKLPIVATQVDLNAKAEVSYNPYDKACFGDSNDGNYYYSVPITLSITYEIYRCYKNDIDKSNCKKFVENNQCKLISPDKLDELECYNIAIDTDNPKKQICTEYLLTYECKENLKATDCLKWETKTVCNSSDVVIPDITLNENDFSSDFKNAIAFAQAVNELKHVWSGEPKVCESGWWNSIIENPTDYFVNKMISMGIAYFGTQFYSAIKKYAQAASFCISPDSQIVGASDVGDCLYTVAQSSYVQGGSPMKDLFNTICGKSNSSSLCDKLTFLSDPWISFGVSLAIDIITSFDKCNSCTSESCAAKHNDYQEYVLISKGLCHYVGSKCSWKIDVGFSEICLRRAYKYCCYNSKFARILVEQAYQQLGYSFGSWDNPNCSALTFDDLKKLDFSKMDFSELTQEIQAKMQYKIDKNYIENKIKNFYDNVNVSPSGEVPWN